MKYDGSESDDPPEWLNGVVLAVRETALREARPLPSERPTEGELPPALEPERIRAVPSPAPSESKPQPDFEPFMSQAETIVQGMAGMFDDRAVQDEGSVDDVIAEIAQALAVAYKHGKEDAAELSPARHDKDGQ